MNMILMRPEHPLLIRQALLLIRVRVFDPHRLPRSLGNTPGNAY
jgi:hypothetical protein